MLQISSFMSSSAKIIWPSVVFADVADGSFHGAVYGQVGRCVGEDEGFGFRSCGHLGGGYGPELSVVETSGFESDLVVGAVGDENVSVLSELG